VAEPHTPVNEDEKQARPRDIRGLVQDDQEGDPKEREPEAKLAVKKAKVIDSSV
jgi:hypothetical protein